VNAVTGSDTSRKRVCKKPQVMDLSVVYGDSAH
jgi:hypothetical protein